MAKINRIVRRPQLSNFQQGRATGAAAGFDVIAAGLEELDKRLTPVAAEQLKQSGEAVGREEARVSLGEMVVNNPRAVITGGGGDTSLAGAEYDWSSLAVGGAAARSDSFSKLDPAFAKNVYQMAQDARKAGIPLQITSAYRSPELQGQLFQAAVKKYGSEAAARKWVAPPGRSKHNTGTAVDFAANGSLIRDANSREAKWIRENAPNYGLSVPMDWEPWQVEPAGSRGGVQPAVSSQGSSEDAPRPTVTVRTREGNLEARMFSPFSGPLLQVHNQAALAAYQSEVYMKAGKDMMDLSFEFEGQPQDFQDASQQYVDQIVSQAPDMIKGAIRQGLEEDAFKIAAGMMEAQQSETRQRANNASSALVERWSGEYADALASGTEEEIASARSKLDSVLRTREALPGIAWTPEQSANVFWKSERSAEGKREQIRKKAAADVKTDLDLIKKSAKDGLSAEAEATIDWETAAILAPEETREALAHVRLRDNTPDLLQMTPGEMMAAIAEMEQQPIQEQWQLDMVDAAKDIAKDQAKAFKEDPVARAAEVLYRKPPAIPDLDPANPDKFIKAIAASVEYGEWMFKRGFTKKPVYFSKEDTERLSLAMSKEQLPEARAAIAGAIVAGGGSQAVSVLDEIGGDSLTTYAGKMLASGAPGALSAEIMRGQSLIENKSVEYNAQLSFEQAINDNFGTAFQSMPALPGGRMPQNEIAEAARAIYASRTYGESLTDSDAKAAMKDSINAALGQSQNKAGEVTGGIQEVAGMPTLLPIGVSGEDADRAISLAMGTFDTWAGSPFPIRGIGRDRGALIWQEAAGGPPYGNSEPLSAEWFRSGRAQIVPTGGNMYRISIAGASGSHDALDADGNVFEFDIERLIEAAQ